MIMNNDKYYCFSCENIILNRDNHTFFECPQCKKRFHFIEVRTFRKVKKK